MKTQLIYFDSNYQSGFLGTSRGFLSIIILLLFFLPMSYLIRNRNLSFGLRFLSIFIFSLVLCSAVGVQLPKNIRECILYNFLVGMVISVCIVCFLTVNGNYRHQFLLLIPTITTTIVLSGMFTYHMSTALKLYS